MSTVMAEKKTEITRDTAIKYLNLYVAESDWDYHLQELRGKLLRRNTPEQAQSLYWNSVAFAILGPELMGVQVPDKDPAMVLYRDTWSQCKERDDWFKLLEKRVQEDAEIEKHRNECLSLGIVYPLDYSPITRQAFNWLYDKAEEAGVISDHNKKDMIRRFQNLVYAYGGNVICYIFIKEEGRLRKKILNWRSNYFFERLIFDVYSPEELIKIKKQELNKTNSKLVKKVRAD